MLLMTLFLYTNIKNRHKHYAYDGDYLLCYVIV